VSSKPGEVQGRPLLLELEVIEPALCQRRSKSVPLTPVEKCATRGWACAGFSRSEP
jgi:hypothetical protein